MDHTTEDATPSDRTGGDPVGGDLVDEERLPAHDGRIPGRRGRRTRDRLLQATESLLETTSYRELAVVDIAREVGSSPATFYQYFSDVEAAVLLLAQRVAEEGESLTAPLRDAAWSGAAAYRTSLGLADAFLEFWDENEHVLRVVDLAIVEGDRRFRQMRNRLLQPVTERLGEAVAGMRDRGRHPEDLDPTAQAAVVVSMLVHVAEHHPRLGEWNVDLEGMRHSMARIVCWSVTGRKPVVA